MKDLGTAVPFCRPFRVCREKDSAQTLRTGRPRGEFVFGQNSTAETQSTPRLRGERPLFSTRPNGVKTIFEH